MRVFSAAVASLFAFSVAVASPAPEFSVYPKPRPQSGDLVLAQATTSNAAFARWIDRFRGRARAAGIRDSVFNASFQGVRYNTSVVQKDRNQSEFTSQIWDYLDSAASSSRVRNGRDALRENRRVLAEIEAKYGVEAEVVTAVWGLESSYGSFRGDIPIVEALATLAFDGRRGRFCWRESLCEMCCLPHGRAGRCKRRWPQPFLKANQLGVATCTDGGGEGGSQA